jgi:mannose-1-phosphate guanylyltransferase/mannose-1-phosphate guanylyltransferase/mannose-6-phosphate isomerase
MIPLILSGGSGTRLWPVSRASYPKQFCDLYDKSFLRTTVERLRPLGEPFLLTVKSMEALTFRLARELDLPLDRLLYEPMGRNTAPAIALACHVFERRGLSQEIVGVFPADHLVLDTDAFYQAVRLAERRAQAGDVVTIGIEPRYAATGYGYIEIAEDAIDQDDGLKAFAVRAFHEKPDAEKAARFVREGRYYWNAGMFVFRVADMIAAFKDHMPELWSKIESLKGDLERAKYVYANLPNQSIDYGVMEKLRRQSCIPARMGWSDVGSWDELARLADEAPELRSDSKAEIFDVDSTGNYVFSVRPKVVGLINVENMIVVDTPDALLIAAKGQTQNVKQIVDEVRERGRPEATEHPFETRPWGGFEVLAERSNFKAKTITVDVGAQLSYQSHRRREEHWIVVEGEAEVILDDVPHRLTSGQYLRIPEGAKHRIRNSGNLPLVFVEVQTGSYFGEDDIIRYSDDYRRV